MYAALLKEYGKPLEIVDDITVAPTGPGQVRIRVEFCGICHSDLHMGGGLTPLPLIAGHEAAGVIEETGEGVVDLKVGDRVVISPSPSCGRCEPCLHEHPSLCFKGRGWMKGLLQNGAIPFYRNGASIYRGNGVGAWAESVVMDSIAAVRIPDDLPLELACLIGCGVQTGIGAVLNTARVEPGSSVLVMGLGGVGLSVVQGARIAGASAIVVSDPVKERREVAMRLGATIAIDPNEGDVVKSVKDKVKGGVDYAFDVVGSPALVAAGVRAIKPGGAMVMVGSPMGDDTLSGVHQGMLIAQEKRLLGSMLGSCNAARDVPRIIDFWRSGALNLEMMATAQRPLREVNEGLDDLRNGKGVRTVLSMRL
jgi:S-(hydroxymethyl)glutathione dehydrogenase / alcohol dehydrogenase